MKLTNKLNGRELWTYIKRGYVLHLKDGEDDIYMVHMTGTDTPGFTSIAATLFKETDEGLRPIKQLHYIKSDISREYWESEHWNLVEPNYAYSKANRLLIQKCIDMKKFMDQYDAMHIEEVKNRGLLDITNDPNILYRSNLYNQAVSMFQELCRVLMLGAPDEVKDMLDRER